MIAARAAQSTPEVVSRLAFTQCYRYQSLNTTVSKLPPSNVENIIDAGVRRVINTATVSRRIKIYIICTAINSSHIHEMSN